MEGRRREGRDINGREEKGSDGDERNGVDFTLLQKILRALMVCISLWEMPAMCRHTSHRRMDLTVARLGSRRRSPRILHDSCAGKVSPRFSIGVGLAAIMAVVSAATATVLP